MNEFEQIKIAKPIILKFISENRNSLTSEIIDGTEIDTGIVLMSLSELFKEGEVI